MHESARHRPGAPCWTSLMVHSLAATEDFYHALFGWEFAPGPEELGGYVRATLDGTPVAGIGELPAERHLPVAWTTYLATDDADETAEMIRACGGTVAVGPLDAEEAGRVAIASDPAGATFGVWQEGDFPGGSVPARSGTPVWHELMTRETVTVRKFYESVFGYESRADTPDGDGHDDRLSLLLDGRPVAAVRGVGEELLRGHGPHWMAHFEVADVDETAQRLVRLGGYVVQPAHDATAGRMATVSDPEGAVFTIVRSAR